MEKPDLKLFFNQVIPALPNPYEFSEKIAASIGFIDDNPDAGPFEISGEMLDMWSVTEDEAAQITSRFIDAEKPFANPNTLSSLIIFAHLYLHHYRLEDFADLENFIYMYGRFQTLLHSLKNMDPYFISDNIRLFDLDSLNRTIDTLIFGSR